MSCACASSPSESSYGPTFYVPAGTTARFVFEILAGPNAPGLDLTDYTPTLYAKTALTVADANAKLTATTANGKLTWLDRSLGLLAWDIAPADFNPADYTPGAPWIYTLRLVKNTGATYIPVGATGHLVLDALAPACAPYGTEVAYAPAARARAVGPDDSPIPVFATTAYVDAALAALLTRASAANDGTGNTTLSLPAGSRHHTVDLVFTGAAGTRIVIADTAGAQLGDVLRVDYTLPATAGLVVELRNATAGGTLLDTLTTDASGDSAFVALTYSGTVWQFNHAQYPAN